MLSDVGLSLGDNTAMETTQTEMPSSARMLEPVMAEKSSKPGEGEFYQKTWVRSLMNTRMGKQLMRDS